MLKRILSICLAAIILTVASGASAFAQSRSLNANENLVRTETKTDVADLKSVIKAQTKPSEQGVSNKSTLADYERSKRQGKGLSTTTKVLIGVGVAVAILAIVAIVVKNDVKNDIFR